MSKPSKLTIYRYVAGVVLVALGGAATVFADQAPWLVPLSSGAAWAFGKYLGIPVTEVIRMGLQLMTPERAVAVTISALQSAPPAKQEAAAEAMIASLPPTSLVRFSIHPPAQTPTPTLNFIGTEEPYGDDPRVEPTEPQRPLRR